MENLLTAFQEMTADSYTYYEKENLDSLNFSLMCESKKGAIIAGKNGSGKTAYVRRFLQQDLKDVLGFDNIKVLQIYEEVISKMENDEDFAQKLLELCQKYQGYALILYVRFSTEKVLNTTARIFNRCSETIKKMCNNSMLKVIFEITTEQQNNAMDKLRNMFGNSFNIIEVDFPDSFENIYNVAKAMAKNLTNIYKTKIETSILYFALTIMSGYDDDSDDLNYYYSSLEILYVMARKEGKSTITKNIVKNAYSSSFDSIRNSSYEELLQLAFHECGHALFILLNKKEYKLNYVSLIPGLHYRGVTTYTPCSKYTIENREYAIYLMAKSLAGREAENLYLKTSDPNAGATNDLRRADDIVSKLITKNGDSVTIGKNCIVQKDEYISDQTKRELEREKIQILKEATHKAYLQVKTHKEFIEKMAKKLVEKLLLTGKEIEKMWEQYCKEKSNN